MVSLESLDMMLDLLVASQWALPPAARVDKKDWLDMDFGMHICFSKISSAPRTITLQK
jgi:hypothetical protein